MTTTKAPAFLIAATPTPDDNVRIGINPNGKPNEGSFIILGPADAIGFAADILAAVRQGLLK